MKIKISLNKKFYRDVNKSLKSAGRPLIHHGFDVWHYVKVSLNSIPVCALVQLINLFLVVNHGNI